MTGNTCDNNELNINKYQKLKDRLGVLVVCGVAALTIFLIGRSSGIIPTTKTTRIYSACQDLNGDGISELIGERGEGNKELWFSIKHGDNISYARS